MPFLENYIAKISGAQTADDAFKAFCEAMGQHGYDKVAYTLCTDHPSLNLPKQHGLATSYPEEWMKYYVEHNYFDVDPVIKELLISRTPFFWNDLVARPEIAAPSLKMMQEADEAKLKDGIGISLNGQIGEIVGVGLARSDSFKGKNYEFLATAHLLSIYFHQTYRGFFEKRLDVELSPREVDILSWAAEGKSDEDIAAILNITVHTIRFHWKNIFTKLNANGRVYAIMKALFMKLIVPRVVAYQKR